MNSIIGRIRWALLLVGGKFSGRQNVLCSTPVSGGQRFVASSRSNKSTAVSLDTVSGDNLITSSNCFDGISLFFISLGVEQSMERE